MEAQDERNRWLRRFRPLQPGTYTLSAEKSGLHTRSTIIIASAGKNQNQVDLVLGADSAGAARSSLAMELPWISRISPSRA